MKTVRFLVLAAASISFLGVSPVGVGAQTPMEADTSAGILRAGDVLRITIWPDSSLSGEYPIEETGFAYFPGLGAMTVSGRSIADIRQELREQYARFMSTPVVTVTPLFRVSVLGEVRRPGLYPVDPTHTVFDVISLAGGLTDAADADDVRLLRSGSVIDLDAQSTLEGGGDALALGLRSGDRIVVPRRRRFGMSQALTVLQLVAVVLTLASR